MCFRGWKKREKSTLAHPSPPGPVRSRFRSSVWPMCQGEGSVRLTTESTSAFLERPVPWQLKLRKTGLEMRCYFWPWWVIKYWNSLLGKLAGSPVVNVFEMRWLNGRGVLSGLAPWGLWPQNPVQVLHLQQDVPSHQFGIKTITWIDHNASELHPATSTGQKRLTVYQIIWVDHERVEGFFLVLV